MSESINYKGVCRTALAIPGLLIIYDSFTILFYPPAENPTLLSSSLFTFEEAPLVPFLWINAVF